MGTHHSDERFYSVRLTTEGVEYTAEIWRDAPDRWLLLAVLPDIAVALADLNRPFPSLELALLEAEVLAGEAVRRSRQIASTIWV